MSNNYNEKIYLKNTIKKCLPKYKYYYYYYYYYLS